MIIIMVHLFMAAGMSSLRVEVRDRGGIIDGVRRRRWSDAAIEVGEFIQQVGSGIQQVCS